MSDVTLGCCDFTKPSPKNEQRIARSVDAEPSVSMQGCHALIDIRTLTRHVKQSKPPGLFELLSSSKLREYPLVNDEEFQNELSKFNRVLGIMVGESATKTAHSHPSHSFQSPCMGDIP